ncbi:MAG: helix-turn-helix transcriptional regulator [Rhodobacteraceae bacterium]|nr:helix-turn-helix transcriptional regulator [Paracoccaceae bacterium]
MISIETDEKFKVLDLIHRSSSTPEKWPNTIQAIESFLNCTVCLIELDHAHRNTHRYGANTAADALITFLKSTQVEQEGDLSAFCYMVSRAELNQPYCKLQLAPVQAKGGARKMEPVTDAPGFMTTVFRSSKRIVIFSCLWNSAESFERHGVTSKHLFQPFSEAVSASISTRYLQEDTMHRCALLENSFKAQSQPVCIVDENLNVQSMTGEFKDFLARTDFFTLQQDKLIIQCRDLFACIQNTLAAPPRQIVDEFAEPNDETRQCEHIATTTDRHRLRITFRKIPTVAPDKTRGSLAYILIEVKSATRLSDNIKNVLNHNFGLSKGEVRLAYDLATSGSLNETLANLNITRNTAKTHLRRIYEKTGVQTQVELMRLILGLAGMY